MTAPGASKPAEAALAIRGLRFSRGGRAVLEGVDLAIAAGTVCCLVGPSGCGKSTLLALAGGLLAPDAGAVGGTVRRPAFAFQDPTLLPWRTAATNVAFALKGTGLSRRERRDRAAAMLARVGLAAEAGRYPRQLSGGMRQRVALARALLVDADLVLLDEPFSALDIGLARAMHALVRARMAETGATALVVTHDLAEAVRLGDRIVVLSAAPGRVVHVHDVAAPFAERSDRLIDGEIGRLLREPAVIASLLPGLGR